MKYYIAQFLGVLVTLGVILTLQLKKKKADACGVRSCQRPHRCEHSFA